MLKNNSTPTPLNENTWMKAVHRLLREAGHLARLPRVAALSEHTTWLAFSDYGGDAPRCPCKTYAFLYVAYPALVQWHNGILDLKERFFGDHRTLSYKGLGDKRKQQALPHWLELADQIPGLLVVVCVDKQIPNLFIHETGQRLADLLEGLGFAGYDEAVAESTLRILHLVCYLGAAMLSPEHSFLWKTDEDAIAGSGGASPRLDYLGKLFHGVMNLYIGHPLQQFGYAVGMSDDETRLFEDPLSLPDLSAGVLADSIPTGPNEQALRHGRARLLEWLAGRDTILWKLILRIRFEGPGEHGLPLIHACEVRLSRDHGATNRGGEDEYR